MLITKVHALSQGFSGIRLTVVERMLKFIELILSQLFQSKAHRRVGRLSTVITLILTSFR